MVDEQRIGISPIVSSIVWDNLPFLGMKNVEPVVRVADQVLA